MELCSAKKQFGMPRTIVPFPDHPEVSITMKDLPSARLFQIWDKHGIRPNSDKNTWSQWARANREVVIESVDWWEGITVDGAPLPCIPENKVRLLDEMFPDPDDPSKKVTAWQVIQKAFELAEANDRKN